MKRGRGPVVYLDRVQKAKMIEAVLQDFLKVPVSGFQILDYGAGNGDISEYLAGKNEQYAVDIKDQRKLKESKVQFIQIESEKLPFEDHTFDIIISHHVIEHVSDQDLYIEEMRRVVKEDGICYLGTPNRSSPFMEGHKGNRKVLKYREMDPFFKRHGFRPFEYSAKTMKEPSRFYCEVKIGRHIPTLILNILKPMFPSHCFILVPRNK